MGRFRWQWLALCLSAAVVLLAAPPALSEDDICEGCEACRLAEAADDDEAGDEQPATPEDEEAAGEDEALPVLDLAGGVTADAAEPAAQPEGAEPEAAQPEAVEPGADILAAGVTVTADTAPPAEAAAEPEPAAPTDGEQLTVFSPPLWTPNSERFLLRDRQQELSLTAEADTTDVGDGAAAQPRPAASPAPRPAAPAADETTPQPSRFELPPAPAMAGPVNTGPAAADAEQPAESPAGIVGTLNLPPGEELLSGPPEIIPSEQFSAEELAEPAEPLLASGELAEAAPAVGVIATSREQALRQPEPTLDEVLSGEAEDQALGSQVPGLSPWRSGAIILVCLALLFAAIAIGKRFRLSGAKGAMRALSVIETISLGAGRQITIMEMGDSALILGVTPQSINLLDKVPLVLMSGSYQGTVNAIIDKESQALPSDWAQRPVFTIPADQEAPRLAPPLSGTATYGPGGRRVSVSELRQRRARSIGGGGTTYGRPAAARVSGDARTKAQLIGRLREQLSRLEE